MPLANQMLKQQASKTKIFALASLALVMWFAAPTELMIMRAFHFDLPGNHPAVKYLLGLTVVIYILSAALLIYSFRLYAKHPDKQKKMEDLSKFARVFSAIFVVVVFVVLMIARHHNPGTAAPKPYTHMTSYENTLLPTSTLLGEVAA